MSNFCEPMSVKMAHRRRNQSGREFDRHFEKMMKEIEEQNKLENMNKDNEV